jgi:hypothetical protein
MTADMEGPPDADEILTVARAKEYNRLLLASRPNVIGLDVGYRVRGGQVTDERVVKVYVSQKLDPSMLAEDQLIPSTVRVDDQEIGVDVEEGSLERPIVFNLRSRPLRGGSSISAAGRGRGGTGTLGVCVTLNDANTYILTCNHVIAGANTFPIGTNIIQPSLLDGGTAPADNVATLSNFFPIDFGSTTFNTPFGPITILNPNRVDAALGVVVNAYNTGNREIHWIGYPPHRDSGLSNIFAKLALIGRRVCKMGRTSEFTLGRIISPFFDTIVGPYVTGQNARFIDQIRIQGDGGRPFAQPGDSGSLIAGYPGGDPIGLLMSANTAGTLATANPLDVVMNALAIPQV